MFSRLAMGYIAVFIMVIAASAYAIVQLRRFNDITRSVLDTDHRILDYEKKYIITKDDAIYDQFVLLKNDFDKSLEEGLSIADSKGADLLRKTSEHHRRYQALFQGEVKSLKEGRSYPQSRIKREKEAAVEGVMVGLGELKAHSERSSRGKMEQLAAAGVHAGRVAMLITGASLVFIIAALLFITRSINQPISILKRKTREIVGGNFEGDLSLSSPPEIAELADAFNLMCHKLKDLDKAKSDFFPPCPMSCGLPSHL